MTAIGDPKMKCKRVTVTGCARCGGHHPKLLFHTFRRLSAGYTWWASCPATGEPLLLQFYEGNR